jgi:hypothetical protein
MPVISDGHRHAPDHRHRPRRESGPRGDRQQRERPIPCEALEGTIRRRLDFDIGHQRCLRRRRFLRSQPFRIDRERRSQTFAVRCFHLDLAGSLAHAVDPQRPPDGDQRLDGSGRRERFQQIAVADRRSQRPAADVVLANDCATELPGRRHDDRADRRQLFGRNVCQRSERLQRAARQREHPAVGARSVQFTSVEQPARHVPPRQQ